jgi:sugar phosphate isomerase/epimerase
VESIRLTPAPADYVTILEAAAELGARYINTMCEDPDLARLSDTFAALVEAAAPYGVRPLIEFMAYRSVATLKDAATIASRSGGGGILIDALHVQRCGVGLDELTATDPGLFGYLQLCDAPLKAPADEIREARAGRLLPGDGQLPLRDLLDPARRDARRHPGRRGSTASGPVGHPSRVHGASAARTRISSFLAKERPRCQEGSRSAT